MERVAFLVEATGQRLSCLLNPETLVLRRQAGVQPRQAPAGLLSGRLGADHGLLYTGGGITAIELDLLFDVTLAGLAVHSTDVRDHTRPLWNLAENTGNGGEQNLPPYCRFIWGKTWNILCVVASVAERFDHFDREGVPRRSWFRMRLLRVETTPSEPVQGLFDYAPEPAGTPAAAAPVWG